MGRSQILRHPKRVVEDMGTFPKLLMSCVVDIEATGLLMHLNMPVNLSGMGWSEFQFKVQILDDFG